MIKFKTLLSYILFITTIFFDEFPVLKIAAQNPILTLETGQPLVKCLEFKSNQLDSFASDNNFTLIVEKNGTVRFINSLDYMQIWNIQMGSKLEIIPLLYMENILLLSFTNENENITSKQNTTIRQINSLTGITDWIRDLDTVERFSLIPVDTNGYITLLSAKLHIQQIDTKTGKTLWKMDLKGELKTYTTGNNSIHILTTDNKLYKINTETGSLLSESNFKSDNISVTSYLTDSLLFGNTKGGLYKLSLSSKNETKLFRTGGEISFIELYENDLLVTSNDNFLYYYSTGKEKILWKKRLSGRVTIKPVIYQNLIFVTTPVEPVIYIFNRTDGSLINQITLGENYIIKKLEVNENGLEVLTTDGLLKFGVNCQN